MVTLQLSDNYYNGLPLGDADYSTVLPEAHLSLY